MREVFYITLLILGFGAVLFAAYWLTRFIGSKMSYSNTARHIKVLDRVFLGNEKSICIIEVGKRFFIVGVTKHHIEPIGELDESDLVPILNDKDGSFNNLFEMYLGKLGYKNKGNGQDVNKIQ